MYKVLNLLRHGILGNSAFYSYAGWALCSFLLVCSSNDIDSPLNKEMMCCLVKYFNKDFGWSQNRYVTNITGRGFLTSQLVVIFNNSLFFFCTCMNRF